MTKAIKASPKVPIKLAKNRIASLEQGPPDDPKYIDSIDYCHKYGLHKNEILYALKKGGIFLSQERAILAHKRYDSCRQEMYVPRWFIFDLPPVEHPGWKKYQKKTLKNLRHKAGEFWLRHFDSVAPILLEKFDVARTAFDHTIFTAKEMASMLGIDRKVIDMFAKVGIPGYGKLPMMKITNNEVAIRDEAGKYVIASTTSDWEDRNTKYFDTKDVRRFFRKELEHPESRFKTPDDVLHETNQKDLAAQQGWYVYDPYKVYPITEDGFLKWLKDKVLIYNKRLKQPVPIEPNIKQREFYNAVFQKGEDGLFLKHKMVCISRPRAEYKTTDVCLILLFFFFNAPLQAIFLISCLSELQTAQTLMKEIKDILNISPELKNHKWLEILDEEVRIMSGKRTIYSFIKIANIESGALSNATIFVFTEFYELRDRKKFAVLEGSTRATPNAFTMCEGIASNNKLWNDFYHAAHNTPQKDGHTKDPLMYFQWYGDAWYNPWNTAEERSHFLTTHGEAEFNRHFRNLWDNSSIDYFTKLHLLETGVYGIDKQIGPSLELTAALTRLIEIEEEVAKYTGGRDVSHLLDEKGVILRRLKFIDDLYSLPATPDTLDNIRLKMEVESFYVGIGGDRASSKNPRADRTFIIVVARTPLDEFNDMYFILGVHHIDDHSQEKIKRVINDSMENFNAGRFHMEQYQGDDLVDWASHEKLLESKIIPGSYKQKDIIFPRMYTLMEHGLLKCPTVPLWTDGTDNSYKVYHSMPPDGIDDIFRSELKAFIYIPPEDSAKIGVGYYGSKHKNNERKRTKPNEAKDDCVEATALAIDAARECDIESIVIGSSFAEAIENTDTFGVYD